MRSPLASSRAVLAGLMLGLGGVVVLDVVGWPGLATPLSRVLSGLLDREVAVAPQGTRFHFIGGVRLEASRLRVAAIPWSGDPYFMDAKDIRLRLRYRDLWRAWRGKSLFVERFEAGDIRLHARRLEDGRGSWPLGEKAVSRTEEKRSLPGFRHLTVMNGQVSYTDRGVGLDIHARLHTREGTRAGTEGRSGFVVRFTGRFRGQPLAGMFVSPGLLPLVAGAGRPVPVSADVEAAGVMARFQGYAADVFSLERVRGQFMVAGPSLGEAGKLAGVTLPSTGFFRVKGTLENADPAWQVNVGQAQVGGSRLSGNFAFNPTGSRPRLTGRLLGQRVRLADLAPAIGGGDHPSERQKAQPGVEVVPDRAFDLASLNRMDAAIRIDVERLELGSIFARPIAPMGLDLVLEQGRLALEEIDAVIAGGRLQGRMSLDGRQEPAQWRADLAWQNVALEDWLKPPRGRDGAGYVAGRLEGQLKATGQGHSAAGILSSLEGSADLRLRKGRVSHLVVELMGIDLAQAIGVAVRGDEALPVGCGMGRLVARKGVVAVEKALLDTRDSVLTMNGNVSLADERLDLRVVASPKDFSPLSLRTPVLIRGTFSAPDVSLDGSRLAARLGGGALLALVSPWAALIPLMDLGSTPDEQDGGCRGALERVRAAAAKERPGKDGKGRDAVAKARSGAPENSR